MQPHRLRKKPNTKVEISITVNGKIMNHPKLLRHLKLCEHLWIELQYNSIWQFARLGEKTIA